MKLNISCARWLFEIFGEMSIEVLCSCFNRAIQFYTVELRVFFLLTFSEHKFCVRHGGMTWEEKHKDG